MAVVRPELEISEAQEILDLIGKAERGSTLFRAKRELGRSLDRALESQRRDKENMERLRRNRRIPDFDETPLTPQSMSRLER